MGVFAVAAQKYGEGFIRELSFYILSRIEQIFAACGKSSRLSISSGTAKM